MYRDSTASVGQERGGREFRDEEEPSVLSVLVGFFSVVQLAFITTVSAGASGVTATSFFFLFLIQATKVKSETIQVC